MLVFAIQQRESAISVHLSPPSWTSFHTSNPHPSRLSQSTVLSSLCYIATSHELSILHMVMYMLPCYSLKSSHPLLSRTLCPLVCSLCLCLYSCPESRFISTICLDSIQPNVFHELLRARFGLTTSSSCKISLHEHHNAFIQKTKENSDKALSCSWLVGGNAATTETLFNPSFPWLL